MTGSPRLPSRGWGPFREEFYSIHSGPPCKDAINGVCEHGIWLNVFGLRVSNWMFERYPRIWLVWANRPFFNPGRRFLERMFPNIKK